MHPTPLKVSRTLMRSIEAFLMQRRIEEDLEYLMYGCAHTQKNKYFHY